MNKKIKIMTEIMLEKNIQEGGLKTPEVKFDFDVEKQTIMRGLKRKLEILDKEGKIQWEDSKNRILLRYDKKAKNEKNFFCFYDGKEYRLTLGDILTDYGWGIKYMLDPEMLKDEEGMDIYRQTAKRILTNEARRNIEKIYDQELVEKTKRGRKNSSIPGVARAHKIIQSRIEKGKTIPPYDLGIISELMVREFMTRLSYLHKLNFIKVERPTIEEDVNKKIDFKIIVVSHKRGVKTADEENIEKAINQIQRLGFQMVSRTPLSGLFKKKEKQIAEMKEKYKFGVDIDIDDIVLIGIHMPKTRAYYEMWLSGKRPPGGPEQYLDNSKKKEIFRALTQGLGIALSDGELEKIIEA